MSKSDSKSKTNKPRNPAAVSAIMRKGGVHKSAKHEQRNAAKQKLKQSLTDLNRGDAD